MLATIVRSPFALNVGGEEPKRSGLLRIAKPEDIPPDRALHAGARENTTPVYSVGRWWANSGC